MQSAGPWHDSKRAERAREPRKKKSAPEAYVWRHEQVHCLAHVEQNMAFQERPVFMFTLQGWV
jgi:hypothetical protein